MRKLVQLFNGGRRPADVPVDAKPDHLRSEGVLASRGWRVATPPIHGVPFNPLANAHNAYAGLDPLRALRVLLFERDAACVLGHMESVALILLLRRLFFFSPKVVVWEVPWSAGWSYRERVARLALPRADACVVFDSSQVALVRARFGAGIRAIPVPFCVDVRFFSPAPVGFERFVASGVDADLRAHGPFVLSVGRDAGRDFQVVADALAGTGVRCVLRTSSPVRVADVDASNVAVLRDHVEWQRYRILYEAASVVVVAARETENACGVTSLLEAMAMGKAVVATRTAALSDYLPPEDAGVVVPVGDVDALRRAVLDLVADPERCARLGRRAREIAVERFSPEAHFSRVAAMLDSVVRVESRPSFRADHLGRGPGS